jgi:hypothetical protein
MKKVVMVFAIVLLATAAFAQFGSYGTTGSSSASGDQPSNARSLTGYVLAKGSDAPVQNAIVYLKNTKTMTVKTFITQSDGNYRFHALSPNIDYEVHAERNGKSSDTKTLSSFDSRQSTNINLRIDTK